MSFALGMDEWTRIGVVATILGVIVCAIPVVQWWLSNRVRIEVRVKGGEKFGPNWASFEGQVVKPYPRLEIQATVINRGKTNVVLQSVCLKDRNRTKTIDFLDGRRQRIKLDSGDKYESPVDFVKPHPVPAVMADIIAISQRILDGVCQDGSFIEIVTADEKTFTWRAKDVCDKEFINWKMMFCDMCINFHGVQSGTDEETG